MDKLRAELEKCGEETKEYFREGARKVLKDSGIDPLVMLGVFIWAYMDLVEAVGPIEVVFATDSPKTKGELN
jgi:hypothetical protein